MLIFFKVKLHSLTLVVIRTFRVLKFPYPSVAQISAAPYFSHKSQSIT